MTPSPSSLPKRVPRKLWSALGRWQVLGWLAIVTGVFAVAFAAVAGAPKPALDPFSVSPTGTEALVQTLQELRAHVTISPLLPGASARTALLLGGEPAGSFDVQLRSWVGAGGTLVSGSTPSGAGTPSPSSTPSAALPPSALFPSCRLPMLAHVGAIFAGGQPLQAATNQTGCFPFGGGYWLLAQHSGHGTRIRLADMTPLTNGAIGLENNAVLAAALLQGRSGGAVQIVWPLAAAGPGNTPSLFPPIARAPLWELLISFLVLVAWRARRLGRPLTDPLPVVVSQLEFVTGVGNLLHRNRARGAAAVFLQRRLGEILRRRLGLPAYCTVDDVDAAAANTHLTDPGAVARALTTRPTSDRELLDLAQKLQRISAGPVPRAVIPPHQHDNEHDKEPLG